MKIFISSDHAGVDEKKSLTEFLKSEFNDLHLEVIDLGPSTSESVHYPEYALKLCKEVLTSPAKGEENRGLLICGSGIGMAMTANKIKGIRAALCRDEEDARLSREHNDANVLCLGARSTSLDRIKKIIRVWLTSKGAEGRHAQRVAMMNQLGGPLPPL